MIIALARKLRKWCSCVGDGNNFEDIRKIFELSHALQIYFDGHHYWGKPEYREFYHRLSSEQILKNRLRELAPTLIKCEISGNPPWEEKYGNKWSSFESKLLTAIGGNMGINSTGLSFNDEWALIGKAYALNEIRKTSSYQEKTVTNATIKKRDEMATRSKRHALLSHVQHICRKEIFPKRRKSFAATFRLLADDENLENVAGVKKAKLNQLNLSAEELQKSIQRFFSSFNGDSIEDLDEKYEWKGCSRMTALENIKWASLYEAQKHYDLRQRAFEYAKLSEGFAAVKKKPKV